MQKEIDELKNRPVAVASGEPVTVQSGPSMEELAQKFATKEELAKEASKIVDLEGQMREVMSRLDAIDKHQDVQDTKQKTSENHLQKHDQEIDELRRKIDSMASIDTSNAGNIDGTALMMQINLLKEDLKIKAGPGELADLRQFVIDNVKESELKTNKSLDGIRHEIDEFRSEFGQFRDKDFMGLEARVTALENRTSVLQKTVENIKIPEFVPSSNTGSSVDDSTIKMILDRVGGCERGISELRDELVRWIKNLQDSLNEKVDKADLQELEKLLMNRMNDIVTAMTKNFADKAETKKALKLFERQLKNLYDLFMSKGGYNNEEEAMFSKKPLGGFSCASCEKDLVNLHGKKVEFMPWSKLPFRDPSERIARVGQGFSKMLSMINPDQLSRYEAGSKFAGDYGAMQQNSGMAQTTQGFHQAPVDESQRFADGQRGNSTVGQRVPLGGDADYKRPGSAGARKASRIGRRTK